MSSVWNVVTLAPSRKPDVIAGATPADNKRHGEFMLRAGGKTFRFGMADTPWLVTQVLELEQSVSAG